MRGLLTRIWTLPLPAWVRLIAGRIVYWTPIRRQLFPQWLIGVCGVITRDDGNIMLLRHTYRTQPWGLPTGFLEYGEQPDAGLCREIREETGLEVTVDRILGAYVNHGRTKIMTVVYRGRMSGGTFTPSREVSDVRFFPPDALPPMLSDQLQLLEFWRRERHGG